MYKILLLEDDEMLSQTLKSLLREKNYNVTVVKNINEALDKTYEERYDLYLFDINVPFGNGIDLLKDLREAGDKTPAFFITALRDIKDISKGFDAGCDDYIKKPFDFDELTVRIDAILRKNNPYIIYGDIKFDISEERIYHKEKELDFGEVSLGILSVLLKNIGKTVHKDRLYDVMKKPSDVALRVQINKIKSELNLNITNIRGRGYRLEEI
jgi:DNA-binding response OmpR family regulator